MRIENGETLIRDFADSDLPLMYKWLTDDRVPLHKSLSFTFGMPRTMA